MKRKRARPEKAIPGKALFKKVPRKQASPAEPRPKKQKEKKQHKVLRGIRNAVLIVVFLSLVTGLGVGTGMYLSIEKEIKDMNVQNLAINYSSFVYYTDSDGNSYELEKLFDDENRIWLDSSQIPQVLKDAIVSIEDERFYKHNGVDIKRTAGAFLGWVKEKLGFGYASYGGSTLTQQVIKNITMEKDRTPIRKVKEMMRAIALEKQLSKDEILTTYLNLVFLANGCYGVEAAANVYFSKTAMELTLPEAAMIAGITQRPSYYDPLKNPENALEKRNIVLKKMYDLGKISEQDHKDASGSPLNLNSSYTEIRAKIYSYFVDNVINEVIADLQTEKGYSDTYAKQVVLNGGLKIYSTMDPDIQEDLEAVYEDRGNFPNTKTPLQSGMVIMDPYNGEIKGMVGGIGEKTESRGLNRATQTIRQPGSSIKPLSVYSPAIDTGKMTAASIVKDEKLTIGDWSPKNAYSGYKGNIPIRRALEVSSNTAAVRALQELGVDTAYDYMVNKYHFTTIKDSDRDLSPLGLGGLTNGVSVQEMAAAYSVFANGGTYIKPHSYTKVVDNTGKVLLEKDGNPTRAIKDSTAFIMTDLLRSVVEGSSGTGRRAKMSNMQVSGKTGTTNEDKDKWFIGYTPYYVGAVWLGFDQPASVAKQGVSSSAPVQIWKMVMDRVHDGLEGREFTPPDSAKRVLICTSTGNLASKGCDYAKYEYFEDGTAPTKYCNNRVGPAGGGSGSSSRSTRRPSGNTSGDDDDPSTSPPETQEPETDSTADPAVTQPPTNIDGDGGGDSETGGRTQPPETQEPAPTRRPTPDDDKPEAPQRPTANPKNDSADSDDDVISLDE